MLVIMYGVGVATVQGNYPREKPCMTKVVNMFKSSRNRAKTHPSQLHDETSNLINANADKISEGRYRSTGWKIERSWLGATAVPSSWAELFTVAEGDRSQDPNGGQPPAKCEPPPSSSANRRLITYLEGNICPTSSRYHYVERGRQTDRWVRGPEPPSKRMARLTYVLIICVPMRRPRRHALLWRNYNY